MTLKGQAETALGAGLWFSAVGGLFGTLVMIFMAPSLAEVAIKFSSFEYFWLVVLGLASAVFIGASSVVKALISLLLGLLVACIGLENPAGHPRFTFGVNDLLSGVELIPMMVGMFAVSEILRYMVDTNPPAASSRTSSAACSPACGRSRRSTAGASCAAAPSAPRSASSPAPAPTWRRGCRMR
jgi:TctA family transporter